MDYQEEEDRKLWAEAKVKKTKLSQKGEKRRIKRL